MKCTVEGWQHELGRWDKMSNTELLVRLRKITKPDKLACFLDMAEATRNWNLYQGAVDRCTELEYFIRQDNRRVGGIGHHFVIPISTADMNRALENLSEQSAIPNDFIDAESAQWVDSRGESEPQEVEIVETPVEPEKRGIYDRLTRRKLRYRRKK